MSGLGEWDDVEPVYDFEPPYPDEWQEVPPVYDMGDAPEVVDGDGVAGHVASVLAGVDVAGIAGSLVAQTVAEEVRKAIQREVAPVVAAAVAEVLTEDRLEQLRDAATAAAEAQLAPDADTDVSTGAAGQAAKTEPPALFYGSVDEFVRELVVPIFSRNVNREGRAELRWAARWWEYPEAIVRLEAMWRSWEHLRLDPATGVSAWLRDHADHHLGVLMSPTGPFARSEDQARPGEPLPYEAPPEGMFPDVR